MEILGVVVIIWQLFNWVIDKFGVWILIVLIAASYKKILILLFQFWNLFLRSYNSSYPAFPRFVIGLAENKRMNLDFESEKAWSKFQKLDEKNQIKSAKDPEVKNLYRYYVQTETESKMMRDEVTFMIEGNIAVSNGKRKIDDVRKEFGDKFGTGQSLQGKYKQEANALMKDWERNYLDEKQT